MRLLQQIMNWFSVVSAPFSARKGTGGRGGGTKFKQLCDEVSEPRCLLLLLLDMLLLLLLPLTMVMNSRGVQRARERASRLMPPIQ